MTTKTYDNTLYFIASDGKTLAFYQPERQEQLIPYTIKCNGQTITRTKVIRAQKETIYINGNRQWWTPAFKGATDLQRVKAEYYDEICEIVRKYPNAIISSYSSI